MKIVLTFRMKTTSCFKASDDELTETNNFNLWKRRYSICK